MSLSAPAPSEGAATALSYLDVVVLVVAAPIMLLIGVPALGYAVGAGVWIALRGVGAGVDHYAAGMSDNQAEVVVRLGYLMGRLFVLALAVILVRRDAGRDDGLTALLIIVFAFTVQLVLTFLNRPRSR
jgi:hypothetical protein